MRFKIVFDLGEPLHVKKSVASILALPLNIGYVVFEVLCESMADEVNTEHRLPLKIN